MFLVIRGCFFFLNSLKGKYNKMLNEQIYLWNCQRRWEFCVRGRVRCMWVTWSQEKRTLRRRNHISKIKGNLAENGRGRRGCGLEREVGERKRSYSTKLSADRLWPLSINWLCSVGRERKKGQVWGNKLSQAAVGAYGMLIMLYHDLFNVDFIYWFPAMLSELLNYWI